MVGHVQFQVADMRDVILRGQLEVMVFNQRRQVEGRKLALSGRQMQILRADGSSEADVMILVRD